MMAVFMTDAKGVLDPDGEGNVGFVAATHQTKFSLCTMATFRRGVGVV